jgi:hypothetical protein
VRAGAAAPLGPEHDAAGLGRPRRGLVPPDGLKSAAVSRSPRGDTTAGADPGGGKWLERWIPAFAGMTKRPLSREVTHDRFRGGLPTSAFAGKDPRPLSRGKTHVRFHGERPTSAFAGNDPRPLARGMTHVRFHGERPTSAFAGSDPRPLSQGFFLSAPETVQCEISGRIPVPAVAV